MKSRKRRYDKLNDVDVIPKTVIVLTSLRLRWVGHLVGKELGRTSLRVLMGQSSDRRPVSRLTSR